ncbi:MAG: bifunctional (p)ppGpp synthetase/guanosine-3',5'-bis(diphosphate) 3'-pyrophosphohydrolase [candidate division Zixibacteria bacterium]|nr:bifunctional (p)ppGpp synthetase/guanosine-3',5'-bis(diphosphate) 3'-pyrophosphohydrolase [candidate division Zixibacteria bacterium]
MAEFIIRVESYNSNLNVGLLAKAFQFMVRAHEGQTRLSGDPFHFHGLETALILAEQHLDSATVAAGLVHDVVEDTAIPLAEIQHEFGEEIAELVDGVTKLGAFHFKSQEEEQAEYFRKMLLSMAKDVRVILIKLADRLHNMRTLEFLPPARQIRVAQETLEIYTHFAHRLGMGKVKAELEDLAFKHLQIDSYAEIRRRVDSGKQRREDSLSRILGPLKEELQKAAIEAEVTGRAKHYYSIYRKMEDQNRPLEDIYDLIATRVIVASVKDCYHALGVIHNRWHPVPDRFFDYIAIPKTNLYQSLHTTVYLPDGNKMEVQIRTWEMHRTAEYGIAAHWLYKEGRQDIAEADKQLSWLREVLEWQKDATSPTEFMEYLKIELFPEIIFVYTPKGELKQLPKGATALDFAFNVHTEVGYHCHGARVNGRIVPLGTPLHSGDTVEVLVSTHHSPSRDWLNMVKTGRARSKIKAWMKKKGHDDSVLLGKQLLERELKKEHVELSPDQNLEQLAQRLNFNDWETVLAGIGNGTTTAISILHKLFPATVPTQRKSFLQKLVGTKPSPQKGGIKVQGLGQMMFHLGQCCQPLPGEEIVGFITRGRGISIHRADCHNGAALAREGMQTVVVEWDVPKDHSFLVKLDLLVEDRKNMLKDITDTLADSDTNIRNLELQSHGTTATGKIILEVNTLGHLNKIMKKISKIKGVVSIERTKGTQTD